MLVLAGILILGLLSAFNKSKKPIISEIDKENQIPSKMNSKCKID